MKNEKVLVYGYGNPGRQDDGLGVLLAAKIEVWARNKGYSNIRTETNYQLNIEDAAEIKEEGLVIFADASLETGYDFKIVPLEPSSQVEFTMHAVHPAFILYLCGSIYSTFPRAYILHLRGYEWEFKEGLSPQAAENLESAFLSLTEALEEGTL